MPFAREPKVFRTTIGGEISSSPKPYSTKHFSSSRFEPGIHGLIEIKDGNVFFYPGSTNYAFVGFSHEGKTSGNEKISGEREFITPDNFKAVMLKRRLVGQLVARIWRTPDGKIQLNRNPELLFRPTVGFETKMNLKGLLEAIHAKYNIPDNVLGRSERPAKENAKTKWMNLKRRFLSFFGRK